MKDKAQSPKGSPTYAGSLRSYVQILRKLREDCSHEVTEVQLNLSEFGSALRRLREDAGISLRGMAKCLQLSPPFLSDCELGHRRLGLNHQLRFVARCAGVNDKAQTREPNGLNATKTP